MNLIYLGIEYGRKGALLGLIWTGMCGFGAPLVRRFGRRHHPKIRK